MRDWDQAMGFDWKEAAAQLATRFPLDRLHPEAVRLMKKPDPAAPWGIACSGGADSVCLVLLLYAHWPDCRDRMRILSFDHRLRGKESVEDVAFTEAMARGLGLAFLTESWERAQPLEKVSEETARAARMLFLEKSLGNSPEALLFFGHQRDDVAETFFMRVARGSGSEGLSAPRPVSLPIGAPVRLRPLLNLSSDEIRSALREVGVPFREDLSNWRDHFYRNRIRRGVLPEWKKVSPSDALAGAALSRDLLEEDDRALWAWLREKMPPPKPRDDLAVESLRKAPRALWRRALLEWVAVNGLETVFSRRAVDEMMGDLSDARPFRRSAGRETVLVFDGRVLRKEPLGGEPEWREGEWVLPWCGNLVLPGGGAVEVRLVELDDALRQWITGGGPDPAREAYVDRAVWENGELSRVRHWRPGDRVRILGASGSRKLKDLFIDRKVPAVERRRLPLVLVGDRIVWIPGWPPSDFAKIKTKTSQVAHLTYLNARSG